MSTVATDVAIVGMACRLPGADSPEQYWANLVAGRESIIRFAPSELDADFRWLAQHPSFVPAGAILEGIELFDSELFHMSAREALLTDPQHRLFLECAWEALERSGQAGFEAQGRLVSLYAGSWASGYTARARALVETPADEFQAMVGAGADYLTTRVSYKLNLRGESLAVQTACSTSLVAVHLACQSLLAGQSDLALAGGVSIDAQQRSGYLFQEGMIGSPDGHCRPFDRGANGTVRGYGLGLVVLKRLDDALADGDLIHAIVKGSAINNDGAQKIGFTAPSLQGQSAVISAALNMAGVTGASISYVEAHGTGTPMGDPIEIAALSRAFQRGDGPPCVIGSVKSNFGHLVEAAGIAGLIKATLTLKHGVAPPTLHYRELNPKIDPASGFLASGEGVPLRTGEGPRRAAVSSFGIGGTNAHVILEEAPPRPALRRPDGRPRAVVLSAEGPAALQARLEQLARWLEANPEASLAQVSFTLAMGRKHLARRRAFIANTVNDLLHALSDVANLSPVTFCGGDPGDGALVDAATRWASGATQSWAPFFQGERLQQLQLPTYPFQRRRFWLEPAPQSRPAQGFSPWLGSVSHPPAARAADESDTQLLLLRAERPEQLAAAAQQLAALAHERPLLGASDLCAVASCAPEGSGAHRAAVLARDRATLELRLNQLAAGEHNLDVLSATRRADSRLAMVFSGQGAQWWGMGAGLLQTEPVFREVVDQCDRELGLLGVDWSLAKELAKSEATSRIHDSEVAQPALFAVQMGLVAFWRSCGVTPDLVVGQSVGEVAAAVACGALTLAEGVFVVRHRGLLMKEVDGLGRTAVVGLSLADAERRVRSVAGVEVAGSNAALQTVLSGASEAVDGLLEQLVAEQVFAKALSVNVAFHSSQMDSLRPKLVGALRGLAPRATQIPFYSSALGAVCPGERLVADYWGHNLRAPFQFASSLEQLVRATGVDLFLEVSPHPGMARAIAEVVTNAGGRPLVFSSLHRGRNDRETLLRTLGGLHTAGRVVRWPRVQAPVAQGERAAARPKTVAEEISALVAEALGLQPGQLAPDAHLASLGLESIGALALLTKLNARFGTSLGVSEMLRLSTVSGIVERLAGRPSPSSGPVTFLAPLKRGGPSQLVLFPGAGGTALMMAGWASPAVAGDAGVLCFDPPGHGLDARPLLTRMEDIVEGCLAELVSLGAPVVLAGYSLGGLVAFAVAKALAERGTPARGVVLAQTLPPGVWVENAFSRNAGFEAVFGEIFERGQVPQESRAQHLAAARSDFQLAEAYAATRPGVLQGELHVIASTEDTFAPADRLKAWSAHCTSVVFHSMSGGHFDAFDDVENRARVAQVIASLLRSQLSRQ